MRRLRLILLVPSLQLGGAERQAVALAIRLARRGHSVDLTTFYPGGPLQGALEGSGVDWSCLGKAGRWDLRAHGRLLDLVDDTEAQLVYSWLPHANVCTCPLKVARPGVKLAWSLVDAGAAPRLRPVERLVRDAEPLLARAADLVIANSRAGYRHALRRGFPPARLRLVTNGIDSAAFAPPEGARQRLRTSLALGDAFVVGMVARLDPVKDHPTFLRAAALAIRRNPSLRFVLVGGGEPRYQGELRALADRLGLGAHVAWTGPRDDVASLLAAFDVATLTSLAEGFPNAVGEAMSAGLPCVVTDVGDCAEMAGESGLVVPRGDAPAIAEAWLTLASLPAARRLAMGRAARDRIAWRFGVDRMVDGTEEALTRLAWPARDRSSLSPDEGNPGEA